MKAQLKRAVTTVVTGMLAVGGGYLAVGLVKDVQFAHARDDVESARAQLLNVGDFAGAYKTVGKSMEPSVVNIQVTKTVKAEGTTLRRGQVPNDLLKKFFDQDGDGKPDVTVPDQQEDSEQIGTGSGVIIEVDGGTGYIVTNNHVAGGATEMIVTLADGRVIKKAKVMGTDPKSDLAVVKIEAPRLIAAQWGNSEELSKGDIIFAFGSPFGYVGSMTHGIVSALNRTSNPQGGSGLLGPFGEENFIQVDAPINPGNSGGPLVNMKGQVVGINTAIISQTGSFNGIGFAIPSNEAKGIYKSLKEGNKVVRGYLGVQIGDVGKQPELAESFGYKGDTGVVVEDVTESSPSRGKLQRGDIITAINGRKTDTVQVLRAIVMSTPPNSEVTLNVFRDEKDQEVKLKVGEQPEAIATRGGRSSTRDGDEAQVAPDNEAAGKLGITVKNVRQQDLKALGIDDMDRGVIITNIESKSPAAKAGLRPGDVVVEVARTPIANISDLEKALAKAPSDRGIRFYITSREGSRFVLVPSAAK